MIAFFKSLSPRQWIKYILLCGIFCLSFLALFTTSESISPVFTTKASLALVTLVAALSFCLSEHYRPMDKYRSRGSWIFLSILSLYSSFATFGQRFFLNGNSRIHFSMEGAFYCLLGTVWFLPLLWGGLTVLEALAAKPSPRNASPAQRRKAACILFFTLLAVQGALLGVFWPGFFPEDAMNQLRPALGLAPLNDWHPALNSLLQRLILAVFSTPGAIVAVQMFCFVLLLSKFLMMGWDRGMKLGWLLLLGGIFLLLPNQALSFSNAMKDYAFTLALLWGSYLLLQMVLKTAWSHKLSFYLCLAVDLFLIACLRHNGMVPMGAMVALCLFMGLKKDTLWRKALIACLAALIAVFAFKGPVYSALGVIPNTQSPFTTMLCAVGSYINKELPLSEEGQQIMETVIPMEDWRDYYSRYVGHDIYYWYRPAGSAEYDTSQITAGKAFRVYLEALFKAPDVILKDRLDGMDILWDVVMPDDSFQGNNFHYTYLFDGQDVGLDLEGWAAEPGGDGHKLYKMAPLAQFYASATQWNHHSLSHVLIWRTGIYLIAFFLLILFWWKNKMGSLWLTAMPMLGNLAASILILYHQSFRYVYFVQLGVLAMVFVTVALRNHMTEKR